jgi:hypothetical protein
METEPVKIGEDNVVGATPARISFASMMKE